MSSNQYNLLLAHRELMSVSIRHYVKELFYQQYQKNFIFGEHHLKICDALDKVIRGETKKLIINIAPRYGKTELCVKMFISYGLALNPRAKFIHLSYSSNLVMDNSVCTKDLVANEYYKHVFGSRLTPGRNSKCRWDTNEGGGVYATSTLGQITGFSAGVVDEEQDEHYIEKYYPETNYGSKFGGAIVIDDPIKPEDALNENAREAVNRRFETTIRNRVNSRNTPIVIIMQRVHEHDLCGYLMEKEPGEWTVLSLPCLVEENGEERALWPFKHTVDELHKLRDVNDFVFETQYQQNPTPIEGFMYPSFRTYDSLPIEEPGKTQRKNYTDTADTGSDSLCSICYIETETGIFVTDVLYTKRSMEYTEPETARMLNLNDTEVAIIESNNGGRGFARNVESNLRKLGNFKTKITTFTQGANKQVRIFSHSAEVCNMVYFPVNWERKWPEFARDMKAFRKEGRNAHDDAPDCVTGMVEKHRSKNKKKGVEVF